MSDLEIHRRHVADGLVEVALVRVERRRRRWREHTTVTDTIASLRFARAQLIEIDQWTGALREALDYLARGEFGCFVDRTTLADGSLRMRLIERRLLADRVETEILDDQVFDPCAVGAVAAAAETFEEWRTLAAERNDAARRAWAEAAIARAFEDQHAAEATREARDLGALFDAPAGEDG